MENQNFANFTGSQFDLKFSESSDKLPSTVLTFMNLLPRTGTAGGIGPKQVNVGGAFACVRNDSLNPSFQNSFRHTVVAGDHGQLLQDTKMENIASSIYTTSRKTGLHCKTLLKPYTVNIPTDTSVQCAQFGRQRLPSRK